MIGNVSKIIQTPSNFLPFLSLKSLPYLALPSLNKKESVTLIVIINVSIKKTNTLGFRTEHHLNQSNHNRAYCTKVVLMDQMPLKKKKKNFASQNSFAWQPKKLKLQMELTVCDCSVRRKTTTCCGAPSGVHSLSHERESWTVKTLIGMWLLRAVPIVITT